MDPPEGYTTSVLQTPLSPELARRMERLLGHKGEPWISDIRERLSGEDLDLFAVGFRDDEPVANVWVGASRGCPELGVLGHVFTVPEHRRRGLAGRLLQASVAEFDRLGGRWLHLHTGSAGARRLYEGVGFQVILEGEAGTEGDGNWLMLRGGEPGVGDAYHEASGRWAIERYAPRHYAGLCVFLNAVPGTQKLPAVGFDTGMDVEQKLLEAGLAQERGELRLDVLVDTENGRPHGLACRRGDGESVYAPRVAVAQRDALRISVREG